MDVDQHQRNWNEQISEIVALRSILGTDFRLTAGFKDHKIDAAGDFTELMEIKVPDPPRSVFCQATVYVEIPDGEIELSVVTCSSSSQPQTINPVRIQHLPAICLDLEMTPHYPEVEKPNFQLSCCWLSHDQLSLVGGNLDKVWKEQSMTQICFAWIDWIHTSLLETLGMTSSRGIVLEQSSKLLLGGGGELDYRVKSCRDQTSTMTVFRNVSEYNRIQANLDFVKQMWLCPICMTEDSGKNFIRFQDCFHYFCKDCFCQYCSINIKDGMVNLTCPGHKCETPIHPGLLKSHITPEEFQRWESLLLKRTLETMIDIQYCPRCSTACVEESGNFSQCTKCHFAFCTKCFSSWHPGSGCIMIEDKIRELNEVEIAKEDKIRELNEVETAKEETARRMKDLKNQTLSLNEIKKKTRPCPLCGMAIEKTGGCNHMVCLYCNTHYCYACLKPVFNGYDHFRANTCTLFDQGAIVEWEREMNLHEDVEGGGGGGGGGDRVINVGREDGGARQDIHRMIRCGNCRAMNYKMDKNNHIRCYVCAANLCFLCKEVLPRKNATAHFQHGPCAQHTDLVQ